MAVTLQIVRSEIILKNSSQMEEHLQNESATSLQRADIHPATVNMRVTLQIECKCQVPVAVGVVAAPVVALA